MRRAAASSCRHWYAWRRDAAAAFYVDATGAVRRLDPSGTSSDIAKLIFPSPQVILSFGIEPDGRALMAIVDSISADGRWSLDLENAGAGGQTSIGYHRDLGTTFPTRLTEITGWDYCGPTATLNSLVCVQQAPPSLEYTGDALVHLSQDGSHVDRIGGPNCIPWDENVYQYVLCGSATWDSFTVRSGTGMPQWSSGGTLYREPKLSPEEEYRVAFDGATATVVTNGSAGPPSPAPSPVYRLLGWAGRTHIAVVREDSHLGLESATGPEPFTDLGLDVGTLCSGCSSSNLYYAGSIGISS